MFGIDPGTLLTLIALSVLTLLLAFIPALLTSRDRPRYTESDRLAEKQAAREAVRRTR